MKYSLLGNTGLLVSRLGFGTMTFGTGKSALGFIYKVGEADARSLVDRCIDAGVNYFNTADVYDYGGAEVVLGKSLSKRRQDVIVATKVGQRMNEGLLNSGLSRRHIIAGAEGSLKRLNTDYIDVYLVHRPDPYTPLEETLDALDFLVREGKVRYLGFSNWPAWLAAKAVGMQQKTAYEPFRVAEVYYSLLGRDLEHEIVPFAADAGIGISVWGPLAGGFLTGKYTRENPGGDKGRLSYINAIPHELERSRRVIDALNQIGKRYGASPAQLSISWLLSRKQVHNVLIGSSNIGQLESNLQAINVEISEDDLKTLDAITTPEPPYPHWQIKSFADPVLRDILQDG